MGAMKLDAADKRRASNKRWREAYKEKHGVPYSRNYFQVNPNYEYSVAMRYAGLLQGAQKRRVLVSLTKNQYAEVVSESCYYCGGRLPRRGHGVDRIDNNQGYILGNVRPCCAKCNKAKSTMSEAEFKNWIQQVVSHWFQKP